MTDIEIEKLAKEAIKDHPFPDMNYPATAVTRISRNSWISGYKVAQSKSEWVSVDERLPDEGDFVLTYPSFRSLPFGYLGDDSAEWVKNSFWVFDGDDFFKPHPYPTHWMPLPSPPLNK